MAARCLSSSPHLLALSLRGENPRHITPQLHGRKLSIVQLHGRNLSIARAVNDDNDGGASESNKGRQLWRTELLSNEFESLDDEVRQSATLERDIQRLAKKEEVEKLLNLAADGKSQNGNDQRSGVLREIGDKVLVADFFFILFILAWLVAGLVERAALESTSLIDSWLPLWPSVFQPALGVFMAGAIVSAVTKKKD